MQQGVLTPSGSAAAHPPGRRPDVSVIVTGWKDAPCLLECLRSLAEHRTRCAVELLVSLNEPAPELLHDVHAQVPSGSQILVSPVNSGFAEANNRAARRARGTYLLFLNDDTVVLDGWMDALVDALEDHPETGVVGSVLVDADGTVQDAGVVVWSDGAVSEVTGEVLRGEEPQSMDVLFCAAASMLTRRSLFEAVGGFDAGYFPAYYEDADLCLKVLAHGLTTRIEAASQVVHRHSASTTSSYAWFLTRVNQERFVQRWSALLERLPPPPRQFDVESLAPVVLAGLEATRVLIGTHPEVDPQRPDVPGPLGEDTCRALERALLLRYIRELEASNDELRRLAEGYGTRVQELAEELDDARRGGGAPPVDRVADPGPAGS